MKCCGGLNPSFPAGATDFNGQLTSLISGNPDAILAPNYYQDNG